MEDFEDDTHFCLKCHSTIIGLEHYVNHRKNNCMKQVADIEKSSIPCQLLTADDSFTLKADDFFSSLELQSSSKKLIQTSTSVKNSGGIFTRSKVTACAKEAPEPSKSGKNAWIGGHQLKQFDYDDNQSKLIKAVANLERRKEDIGRNKEIPTIEVFEECSDDESEDYDFDEETTDEDAPPRNHTGGKWKPSSPIYWKSSQLERDSRSPPPNFTGGKWKPSPTKKTVSPVQNETKVKWKSDNLLYKDSEDNPPPSFTGSKWSQSKKQEYSLPSADFTKGKWKPKLENSTKWHSEYPPPEHTKGKWKPDTLPESLPSTYAKGKWISPGIEQDSSSPKELSPTYTKGKWLPPSKCPEKQVKVSQDSPLRKSGGTVQYWCRPCDRRLASKVVYERHLKSELHFKRTSRDNELEENFNFMKDERRVKRKTIDLVEHKEKVDEKTKKLRRNTFSKCQVCNSKVNLNLMGKHLISHYHCRKGDLTTEISQKMVLDNIESIIHQSPFQCRICRFYCNTNKDFLAHWLTDNHLTVAQSKPGQFCCTYCKYFCDTNETMYEHLISDVHNEVVSVINRSVPICIKKMSFFECGTCNEQFRLNIELKKHINITNHNAPENFESNNLKCDICEQSFNSNISLQRHNKNVHKLKSFMCGICNLTFASSEEAKAHRNTEQHYYATLEKKNSTDKSILEKQCQYCSENFKNFLKLKEHIKVAHTEFHSKCPQCGMSFTVSQELSVHLRTNSCKFEEKASTKKHCCSQCSFGSDSLSQFLFHEALHEEAALMYPETSSEVTDKKPTPHYRCPKCKKFFPKSSLECHIRIHTRERPYTCSHCQATFVRKNNWLFHEKKHRTGNIAKKTQASTDIGRPFLCSTCGASFKKRFILQQHMKIHTGKLYKCIENDCYYAGRSFGELKTHYQTHFDDRNFKCKSCDYKAKTKQQLLRHETIHEPSKKFKCPSCPFGARNAHHLKRHTRVHTGCKPYSCPHCDYKCNSLENLRKHILSTNKHPGKSLYQCKFCVEKHFQTNSFKEFKAHLLTIHPDDMDKIGKIGNSTGVYEADNDTMFFSLGNSNKPVENSKITNNQLNETTEEMEIPDKNSASESLSSPVSSTVTQIHSSGTTHVLPYKVFKTEDICQGSDADNWSLVSCYDVEESGALVPLIKDEHEDILFQELHVEESGALVPLIKDEHEDILFQEPY